MRFGSALLVVGAIIFSGASPAAATSAKGRPSRSDVCGECHRDIYRMWRGSAHAQRDGGSDLPRCLSGDRVAARVEPSPASASGVTPRRPAPRRTPNLEQKVSWEGVSCDICHGIAAVELTGQGTDADLRPRHGQARADTRRGVDGARGRRTRSSTQPPWSAPPATSTGMPRARRS